MPSGRHSGSLQEGRSKHWPGRKPTQRPAWPAGDQAWFNSRIFAGDKSGVAGVELATASEPPAQPAADLGASPFGRRPQPPLSCDLRLNHADFGRAIAGEAPHRPIETGSKPLRRAVLGLLPQVQAVQAFVCCRLRREGSLFLWVGRQGQRNLVIDFRICASGAGVTHAADQGAVELRQLSKPR